MNIYHNNAKKYKKKCINCEIEGHVFKDCSKPINSYGILAYKNIKKYNNIDGCIDTHICVKGSVKNKIPIGYETKFLLVQRKDTIGYIDFIRGKYDSTDPINYEILIQEMTSYEKLRILTLPFKELWELLWMDKKSRTYIHEYKCAEIKFIKLDKKSMIRYVEGNWDIQEWCIPKGRRSNNEKQVDCAKREFIEETGYTMGEFNLRSDLLPLEEIFYGSNGMRYRHVYYIAEINTDRRPIIDQNDILQSGEIQSLEWFNFKQCVNIFRLYEKTKRQIMYKAIKSLYS